MFPVVSSDVYYRILLVKFVIGIKLSVDPVPDIESRNVFCQDLLHFSKPFYFRVSERLYWISQCLRFLLILSGVEIFLSKLDTFFLLSSPDTFPPRTLFFRISIRVFYWILFVQFIISQKSFFIESRCLYIFCWCSITIESRNLIESPYPLF